MAFQTIRGENGVDFIGTDAVDALFALNESGVKTIDALGGNDNVDLFDESGVVGTAEVKLGAGVDTFTMGINSTVTNRLSDSTVNGGPGNDNISTEGAVSTKIRGNENDDDFNLVSNYTNTTINGNSGVDSFTITDGNNLTGTDTITLSNSKILGGSGNDGQMDFEGNADGNATSILAVDSVIQGGKGLDTIDIGVVATGTSGFRVSGGADNDTINVNNTNGESDGVSYNGAAGEDSINFTDTNAADAVTKGGEGNDRITIGTELAVPAVAAGGAAIVNPWIAGAGAISAVGEAGDDIFDINTVVTNTVSGTAVASSTGGKHTIEGGAGGDVYDIQATPAVAANQIDASDREGLVIKINSVSDSAATITGTTVTFDSFTGEAIDNTNAANSNGYGDVIDLRGGSGEELVGNRLNTDEVIDNGFAGSTTTGQIADASYASFAALKTALDGNLAASDSNVANSNTGRISLEMIEVTAVAGGVAAGYYAILNNTNTILDSGDMMFQMATAGGNDATAALELAQIELAIEAGFAL